ncbi:MAG: RDD family protein [Bdellovibrionota bacterium]
MLIPAGNCAGVFEGLAMGKWYVFSDKGEVGPYTEDQLHLRVAAGAFDEHAKIRPEGSSQWTSLGSTPFASSILRFQNPGSSPGAIPKSPSQPVASPPAAAVRYAGFWIRLFALFVDCLIAVVIAIFVAMSFDMPDAEDRGRGWNLLSQAFFTLLSSGMIAKWGGTPGKLLLGLRIVRHDSLKFVSFGVALWRESLFWITSVVAELADVAVDAAKGGPLSETVFLLLVGMVLVLGVFAWFIALAVSVGTHPQKRGWHDRIAGTVVVHVRTLPAGVDGAKFLRPRLLYLIPGLLLALCLIGFGGYKMFLSHVFRGWVKECEAGSAETCRNVAVMLEHGRGVEKDLAQAAKYMERACELKDDLACLSLAYGLGDKEGKKIENQKFDELCEKGHAMNCLFLAAMYKFGDSAPKDLSKMSALYEKACGLGEKSGCIYAAEAYWRGDGVPQDRAKGHGELLKYCDEREKEACTTLGQLYLEVGLDGAPNPVRALYYAEKGCEYGDDGGCTAAAGQYRLGQGTIKDLHRAEQFTQKALEINSDSISGWESRVYDFIAQGRLGEAEKAAKKLTDFTTGKGYPYSTLADVYVAQGRLEEARQNYQKACDLKEEEACAKARGELSPPK